MMVQQFETDEAMARTRLKPVVIAVFLAKIVVAAFLLVNVSIPAPGPALAVADGGASD